MKLHLDKYLDRNVCDNIKGIFIIMVFISHIVPYLNNCGANLESHVINIPYGIIYFLGQLIVVMFLFYSGYGVMHSILHKGSNYISNMPKNRIMTTQLNFMVAVILFLLIQTIFLSKSFEVSRICLSLIGWESLGNSNWYIFVILLCYISTYLVFRFLLLPPEWPDKFPKSDFSSDVSIKKVKTLFWILALVITILTLILSFFKEGWWYSTMLVYPFGMFWCIYKDKIDGLISRHYKILLVSLIIMFFAYQYFPYNPFPNLLHNFRGILFTVIVLMITITCPLKTALLSHFGKNLFPLYIYQRIPMLILIESDGGEWASQNPTFYILVSLILTLLIVTLYKFIEIKPVHLSHFKLA